MLYHASKIRRLKELVPSPSTHGVPYVYAVKSRILALLFGAPKDDFDILIDESEGKPVVSEVYLHAARKVYQGKSCSLYTVSPEGFLSGQTGWESELVSLQSVPVAREEWIPDIFSEIEKAVRQKECVFREYSETPAYQEFLRDEISARVRDFGLSDEQMNADPRFRQHLNRLLGR